MKCHVELKQGPTVHASQSRALMREESRVCSVVGYSDVWLIHVCVRCPVPEVFLSVSHVVQELTRAVFV